MNTSKFLAKVIGIYFLIISIAMLSNMQKFIANVTQLMNDATSMFVVGFVTLILGILLIVSHNIWQWSWRVVITVIAWLTFLKGISVLFYPHFLDKTTALLLQSSTSLYCAAAVDFIIGLYLIYFGFKNR